MSAFFFTLSVVFQTLPFVLAVGLAFAFCLFVLGAYNSPVVGVWVAVGVYMVSQLGGNAALPLGLNLSLPDFYSALLALVLLIRMLTGKLQTSDNVIRLWLLIAVVWGLLFVVGLVRFKTAAGVEFRTSFYIVTLVLYLMSFRSDAVQVARLFTALYSTALALTLLAVYRWGAYALGEVGPWFDPHTPLRVLDASGAMFIAMAMLPGLTMWVGLNDKRTLMMFTAPLLLLAVMVLGHRTVWIVTLAALGAAWWLTSLRRKGGAKVGAVVPVAIGALVIGALFTLAPQSTVTQEFERSVTETQKENSTLAWRVDSWKSLVEDWAASGPLVWPAGKPFGSGNRRYIESQGMETNVGAHSHFVSLLVRGGLLVVVAYLAVQLLVVRRLLRRPVLATAWLGGEVPAVFVIACLVYGISYSIDYSQALFLGLAYAMAVQAGAVPATIKPSLTNRYAHRRPDHLS